MKSSTIRRSTLSRESMEVIENLVRQQDDENDMGEYIRPVDYEAPSDSDNGSKAQEIDLLWQNFKATQFNTNSPTAYIMLGFLIGVVVSLGLTFVTGFYYVKSGKLVFNSAAVSHKPATLEQQAESAQEIVEAKVTVPSEDEVVPPVQNNTVLEQETNTVDSDESQSTANLDKSKMKKYIVKSGDTGESILKHYYGSYSPEKAELVRKVNNLESLDRINIGQELFIPEQ